jgi:hypothetical protein
MTSQLTPGLDAALVALEGEELFEIGPSLVAAVNRRVGAKLVTLSMLRDAARVGVKTRTGERILLVALRAGKQRWTSPAAVIRWTRAVAIADAEGLR